MIFSLPRNLVKTLAKKLVKKLAKNLAKNSINRGGLFGSFKGPERDFKQGFNMILNEYSEAHGHTFILFYFFFDSVFWP